jgi:hypothetical protein
VAVQVNYAGNNADEPQLALWDLETGETAAISLPSLCSEVAGTFGIALKLRRNGVANKQAVLFSFILQ